MTDHRCNQHNNAYCRQPHINAPYVRPDRPDARSGAWQQQRRHAAHQARTSRTRRNTIVAAVIVLIITVVIVLAAAYAGHVAADGIGPLIPTPATPRPTPFPGGWTP